MLEDRTAARKHHLLESLASSARLGITLPGSTLHGALRAHIEEKLGGKSLTHKSVTMWPESLSYSGNVLRVVITGTLGPLGNGRISQIQFLSMSQRQVQTKKYGLMTRERLTNLSSLKNIPTKSPNDFDDLSYCLCFSFLNMEQLITLFYLIC